MKDVKIIGCRNWKHLAFGKHWPNAKMYSLRVPVPILEEKDMPTLIKDQSKELSVENRTIEQEIKVKERIYGSE